MVEAWDEEIYPLPKDSPCKSCACKTCKIDYYKRCVTWKKWFARRWDVIQRAAAKMEQKWG